MGEPTTPAGTGGADEQTRRDVPRWAIIGIFLILAVSALASAGDFFMPVILAFLLTLVFTPLRRSLNRMGVPSSICAVIVIGSLSLSVLAGIATLSGPVAEWAANAPQIGRQIEARLLSLRAPVAQIAEASAQIDKLAGGETDPGTEQVAIQEKGLSAKVAAMAPRIAAQAAFVLVLLFFTITSGDMFYEKVVHVLPTLTDKRRALRIAMEIERRLARYLSTITLINGLLGVAVGITMWALGMPSPALFGLLAFLLNFIPYVGAIAGVILVTVIALITFPDPWWSLVAGGSYLALTTVEGQFVTPYFVGRILQLNTVVVFLSVAFWAWLWSVVGMVIAVPMLVVMRVFAEHIDALEPLGDFLSARGAEAEPPAEPEAETPAASPIAIPEGDRTTTTAAAPALAPLSGD